MSKPGDYTPPDPTSFSHWLSPYPNRVPRKTHPRPYGRRPRPEVPNDAMVAATAKRHRRALVLLRLVDKGAIVRAT